jgi:hypothetical protein
MSQKQIGFRRKAVAGPPEGEAWTWVSREMNRSPAWRARSIHCMRLVEFLQDEHTAHAGLENGNLQALYGQLTADPWHLSRRWIPIAIAEAIGLGLVVAKKGGRRASKEASPTRYRLTFYASREKQEPTGALAWVAPTNEWRKVTAAQIVDLRAELEEMRSKQRRRRPSRPALALVLKQ